ncbi:GTPase HflX-like protein, partial [Trifolium pratense]
AIPRNIEAELSSSNDVVLPLNQNTSTEFQPPLQNEEAPPPTPFVLSDEDKVVTTKLKKKKEQNDDNSSSNIDNRFKLRNGKEVFEEKAYLVGVERKGEASDSFGIEDSLSELEQLADTAGLLVVASTYQKLASPNPRTYIGSGKVSEIKSAINALDVETVIFDDELSAG